MQDISPPTQALIRQRYNDGEPFSDSAEYIDQNRVTDQWHHRLANILWINTLLPGISRENFLLPLANTQYIQNSPIIKSIATPNQSSTLRRGNRRVPSSGPYSRNGTRHDASARENSRQDTLDTPSQLGAISHPQEVHRNRKAKLANLLKPMLDKGPSILICWGSKERCHIVPVIITDPTDEVTAWQAISQAFYAHRGSWRKYLSLFGVNKVEIVDLSIAGQKLANDDRSTGIEYIGIYNSEDLVAKRKHLEQIIAKYTPQEWPCPYNPSTGTVDCLVDCISYIVDDAKCPEKTKFEAERELSLLSLRSIFTQCFFQTEIAALNSLLNREGVINSHIDTLSKLNYWHCPESGELHFRGLLISDSWECNLRHMVLLMIVTLVLLSVALARFIYKDWAIAWNVGCFFVSLIALLQMCTSRSLSW